MSAGPRGAHAPATSLCVRAVDLGGGRVLIRGCLYGGPGGDVEETHRAAGGRWAIEGREVRVNLWDLGGHPGFLEVRQEFYADAQGALLVRWLAW